MAKKSKSSEPQGSQVADSHLRKLPLKPETWQCGIKPLVEPAVEDGRPTFLDMVLVGDHASGMLGMELVKSGKLTSDDVWRALETSMTAPKAGSPRRPMYIHKIKNPV